MTAVYGLSARCHGLITTPRTDYPARRTGLWQESWQGFWQGYWRGCWRTPRGCGTSTAGIYQPTIAEISSPYFRYPRRLFSNFSSILPNYLGSHTVPSPLEHIDWFRHTSPYIRSHRGRTFVIHLGSGALDSPVFPHLIHDLALLHLLGVKLVLVHATRGEIEAALDALEIEGSLHKGVRITTEEVLGVVRDVVASQRLLLESQLSAGLPDSRCTDPNCESLAAIL